MSMITAAEAGEVCICDLTAPVGLSQPTISHHMKQLVNAGLVTSRWCLVSRPGAPAMPVRHR